MLRPRNYYGVERMSALEELEQAKIKEACLYEDTKSSDSLAEASIAGDQDSYDDLNLDGLQRDPTTLLVAPRVTYSTYVSYVEIYNEVAFDLLEPSGCQPSFLFLPPSHPHSFFLKPLIKPMSHKHRSETSKQRHGKAYGTAATSTLQVW